LSSDPNITNCGTLLGARPPGGETDFGKLSVCCGRHASTPPELVPPPLLDDELPVPPEELLEGPPDELLDGPPDELFDPPPLLLEDWPPDEPLLPDIPLDEPLPDDPPLDDEPEDPPLPDPLSPPELLELMT
jgi:hypothetical protein